MIHIESGDMGDDLVFSNIDDCLFLNKKHKEFVINE